MEKTIPVGTARLSHPLWRRWYMLLAILCVPVFSYLDKRDEPGFQSGPFMIGVPLRYDYLPGEPYWGKFGAVDSRSFDLLIGNAAIDTLGRIANDRGDLFLVMPQGAMQDYLGDAAYAVLSHYGVTLKSPGDCRIRISPVTIEFLSTDRDENGQKVCVVKLHIALVRGCAETEMVLFEALVENRGIGTFAVTSRYGFADLLDRTVHGALVKLWASQVLFTGKPLGRGRILKKESGTYGFMPNIEPAATEEGSDAPGIGHTAVTRVPRERAAEKITVSLVEAGVAPTDPAASAPITGSYREEDSVVVEEGKKITLGVLPFENVTGRDNLAAATEEVRGILQTILSRSRTVKVMDREKLSDVLREQALGLSGIMNDSTVVSVGNISGVRVMVAGKLTAAGSYYALSARIINVETSAIVAAVSVRTPDAYKIGDAVPELAAKLLHAFTGEKLEVNRNTMSYPSISPVAAGAVTASVEDAWAVTLNPACLMKVEQRDAVFFISFGKKLSGTLDGEEVETRQPPYEKIGVNVALPLGSLFASGFGIEHRYTFPRLTATTDSGRYDLREEKTVFTLPLALGVNPKLSFGVNMRLHLLEYQLTNPGFIYKSGQAAYLEGMFGLLFKVSERFKAGVTIREPGIYMSAKEKSGSSDDYENVRRETTGEFRFGTAMYPLKWFFFFADLAYEKQPDNAKLQPGYHLAAQLTYRGKPFGLRFMPAYGMIPLYIGYSHEPYQKNSGTQQKYLSLGTGYFLNNLYARWSLRVTVESGEDRKIAVGLPGTSHATLSDYSLVTPLFFCIGYRF